MQRDNINFRQDPLVSSATEDVTTERIALTFEPINLLLEFLDGLLGELGAGFGFLQFYCQGLQLTFEFLDSLIGLFIFSTDQYRRS